MRHENCGDYERSTVLSQAPGQLSKQGREATWTRGGGRSRRKQYISWHSVRTKRNHQLPIGKAHGSYSRECIIYTFVAEVVHAVHFQQL